MSWTNGISLFLITSCTSRMLTMKRLAVSAKPKAIKVPKSENNIGQLLPANTKRWNSTISTCISNEPCSLNVINNTDDPLIFCWIDEHGKLHHFCQINDKSIQDGSVSNFHSEYCYTNHAFVCFRLSGGTPPAYLRQIKIWSLIFVYVPQRPCMHVLTVSKRSDLTYAVQLEGKELDSKIIDNSFKVYESLDICGFHVYAEETVTPDALSALSIDLQQVSQLIPHPLVQKLQQDTAIWVNDSIIYGLESDPTVGRGCTYHHTSGGDWLKSMGLSTEKAGGIEIFDTTDYLSSRVHWGTGGSLVHEFCHAVHNKYCPDGFENMAIRDAFTQAMNKQLYHSVAVHGPQGDTVSGRAKAYACTNQMEFFAELSVAFLWNEDCTTEYNKWYPHNRHQLLSHDPDSHSCLEQVWAECTQLAAPPLDEPTPSNIN